MSLLTKDAVETALRNLPGWHFEHHAIVEFAFLQHPAPVSASFAVQVGDRGSHRIPSAERRMTVTSPPRSSSVARRETSPARAWPTHAPEAVRDGLGRRRALAGHFTDEISARWSGKSRTGRPARSASRPHRGGQLHRAPLHAAGGPARCSGAARSTPAQRLSLDAAAAQVIDRLGHERLSQVRLRRRARAAGSVAVLTPDGGGSGMRTTWMRRCIDFCSKTPRSRSSSSARNPASRCSPRARGPARSARARPRPRSRDVSRRATQPAVGLIGLVLAIVAAAGASRVAARPTGGPQAAPGLGGSGSAAARLQVRRRAHRG